MKLAEKLVSLRKAKGLSQLELAEKMGVSRQAISKWEVGAAVPSTENLAYLGRLYNVPLEYLMYEDESNPIYLGKPPKEEIIIKEADKKTTRKTVGILIAIGIFLTILLGVVFLGNGTEETVSMADIEGSEVVTENENNFDLKW